MYVRNIISTGGVKSWKVTSSRTNSKTRTSALMLTEITAMTPDSEVSRYWSGAPVPTWDSEITSRQNTFDSHRRHQQVEALVGSWTKNKPCTAWLPLSGKDHRNSDNINKK